jgi:DNA replication protein DnaC
VHQIVCIDLDEKVSLMRQKDYWKLIGLKRSLPVDIAITQVKPNDNHPKLIEQLMYTKRLGAADEILEKIQDKNEASTQSQFGIIYAVTPSGVGKTFLAYAVGHQIPTIVIRTGLAVKVLFRPWNSLKTSIEEENKSLLWTTEKVIDTKRNCLLNEKKIAQRAFLQ